jgi:hypothetical protein
MENETQTLTPVAQAVLDAFVGEHSICDRKHLHYEKQALADAIREVAMQIVLSKYQFADWGMADAIMEEMQDLADEIESAYLTDQEYG